jgi:SAM-dependent methyltransferase
MRKSIARFAPPLDGPVAYFIVHAMQRVLEPEIMDSEAEVLAYANADFSDSNQWYVERLVQEFPDQLRNAVDLGCGPADVPIRLARAVKHSHITAVDGSAQMLSVGRRAIEAAALQNRIALHLGRLPGLSLPERHFDVVLSKDMLHHLPDPSVLWREAQRLVKPGGAVFVMDLIRPDSPAQARAIVERVSGNESRILQEDFYNSLCAAFTLAEVREQIRSAGLPLAVEQATERHMQIKGCVR